MDLMDAPNINRYIERFPGLVINPAVRIDSHASVVRRDARYLYLRILDCPLIIC